MSQVIDARDKFAARVAERVGQRKVAEAFNELLYGPRWDEYTAARSKWIEENPDANFDARFAAS